MVHGRRVDIGLGSGTVVSLAEARDWRNRKNRYRLLIIG